MLDRAVAVINTLLTINVFFVLISFAWFAIAVIGKYTDIPLGLDLWQSLWMPLFQPAIGALMGGAIFSGAVSYISKKINP
jgi:hypothetical protein